jgi:hypothetical protein
MTLWGLAAAVGFGAMLIVTAAIQPTRWRSVVKDRDPCGYVPTWTFFAPDPGVSDVRLLWRERLVDGTVGPWHEAVPQATGVKRALWNPTKRARKVASEGWRMIERRRLGRQRSDEGVLELSLAYLMILQHVGGICRSPLGVARQFAIVTSRGADNADGPFEVQHVSCWHELPGVTAGREPISRPPSWSSRRPDGA